MALVDSVLKTGVDTRLLSAVYVKDEWVAHGLRFVR